MISLYLKEIKSFLSSLIGYIVIIVFLLVVSLFMWVFPMEFNVLENGFASLYPLFVMAPWVFMFLIPAITMRSFSEEKRGGTLELLMTKPLTDTQIVLAKFFAGLSLVIVALLPTLVYYFTISSLGEPQGNLDKGGIWGSYLGLVFLGAGFVAIGTFSSAISNNQVTSFIISVFLSFFIYIGFDSISSFDLFGTFDAFIENLGISEHYNSLSRGVIDTRDVLYFLSLSAFFVLLTKTILSSRKW